jgi:hypothetical protein
MRARQAGSPERHQPRLKQENEAAAVPQRPTAPTLVAPNKFFQPQKSKAKSGKRLIVGSRAAGPRPDHAAMARYTILSLCPRTWQRAGTHAATGEYNLPIPYSFYSFLAPLKNQRNHLGLGWKPSLLLLLPQPSRLAAKNQQGCSSRKYCTPSRVAPQPTASRMCMLAAAAIARGAQKVPEMYSCRRPTSSLHKHEGNKMQCVGQLST